ncbi:MAG: putative zinc-binding metallopeptidase [Amaricoccus sp.]
MKLSVCDCGQLLQFEHARCRRCGKPLGFIPGTLELTILAADGDAVVPAARPEERWHRCINADDLGCNWLVPPEAPDPRCASCRLNRNLADMRVPANLAKWRLLECAKRRLLYAMMRFGVPISSQKDGEVRGLAFDFLEGSRGAPVMTGHANGLITINISEADSAERERQRVALGESYRTLLGHLRHEAGHYYQDILVHDAGRTEECRTLFGDERESYKEAIDRYYEHGPRPGWEDAYVSAYATMHPWEDFAETWTHYLHMVDTLDTGESFGLSVKPKVGEDPRHAAVIDFDPYRPPDVESLGRAWLPLTAAVNSLNRSMGQPDLYPFDPSPNVLEKVRFIHEILHPDATPARPGRSTAASARPRARSPARRKRK